ncbi:MAG: hypothetical protein LBC73_09025, partial [Oscillospiraceae bacterium]|nr:hypothetical protein [Oscillospiraceae bacterium]MDR2600404.1 hypothetical protein [Oscillospiraceae bacterium]
MSDIEFLILFCVVGFLLILFLFVLMFIDQVKQVKNEENQNFSNNRNFIIKPAKSIIGYGIVGLIFSFFIGG